MEEEGLCAEIKDAENAVALTEEKCATTTQRIPEIMELEKTEKDRVTHTIHIFVFIVFKKGSQRSQIYFFPLL